MGSKMLKAASIKLRAGRPSRRTAVSRAITSLSVELWLTACCFLQSQVSGTKLRGPTRHRNPPEDDFDVFKQSAKLASLYNAMRISDRRSPTKDVIHKSAV